MCHASATKEEYKPSYYPSFGGSCPAYSYTVAGDLGTLDGLPKDLSTWAMDCFILGGLAGLPRMVSRIPARGPRLSQPYPPLLTISASPFSASVVQGRPQTWLPGVMTYWAHTPRGFLASFHGFFTPNFPTHMLSLVQVALYGGLVHQWTQEPLAHLT